jgi:hypothetical protein
MGTVKGALDAADVDDTGACARAFIKSFGAMRVEDVYGVSTVEILRARQAMAWSEGRLFSEVKPPFNPFCNFAVILVKHNFTATQPSVRQRPAPWPPMPTCQHTAVHSMSTARACPTPPCA